MFLETWKKKETEVQKNGFYMFFLLPCHVLRFCSRKTAIAVVATMVQASFYGHFGNGFLHISFKKPL